MDGTEHHEPDRRIGAWLLAACLGLSWGPAFGFGPEPRPQRRAVAVSATLGLIAVIALEASLSPR
ncbi:MAG: hypothetical protein R3F62_21645 [Planctomycetota bacterium]